jgi:hypothetical protein
MDAATVPRHALIAPFRPADLLALVRRLLPP